MSLRLRQEVQALLRFVAHWASAELAPVRGAVTVLWTVGAPTSRKVVLQRLRRCFRGLGHARRLRQRIEPRSVLSCPCQPCCGFRVVSMRCGKGIAVPSELVGLVPRLSLRE